MVEYWDTELPSKPTLRVFGLYILSFGLGALATWIVINFPLTTSQLSIYKLVLGGAAFLAIAGPGAGLFVYLTKTLVIRPLEEEIENATTKVESKESQSTTGGGGEIELETVKQGLEELGYTDYEGEGRNDNSIDENRSS